MSRRDRESYSNEFDDALFRVNLRHDAFENDMSRDRIDVCAAKDLFLLTLKCCVMKRFVPHHEMLNEKLGNFGTTLPTSLKL